MEEAAPAIIARKPTPPSFREIRDDATTPAPSPRDHALSSEESTRHRVNRLFLHDLWIVANATRATFAGWHDKMIAALMVLGALAAIQSWFAYRSWAIAASTASGVSFIAGLSTGWALIARMAFHSFDGLLPADALHRRSRRRYTIAWHGIAVSLVAAVALIARPSLILTSVTAYVAGAAMAGLTGRFRITWRTVSSTRFGWALAPWLRHSWIGAATALVLILALLPARALGLNALIVTAGIGTVSIGLMLTKVDDGIVRFMTAVGHGPRRMVLHHAKGMLAFGAVSIPGSWLILGFGTAGVVAGASTALLVLLVLRVLAYRLHDKRPADFLIATILGLLMLTAYYMPIALPIAVIAILLRIGYRGTAKTWLLA